MELGLTQGDLALLLAVAGSDPARQAEWCLKQLRKALNRQADGPLISEFTKDFWPNYPRKIGIGAARTAYVRARGKVDAGTILRGLAAYVQHIRSEEKQFIAHASTWLNQERWMDEYPEKAIPASSNSLADSFYGLRSNLDHLLKTGRWFSKEPDPRYRWPAWWPRQIREEYAPKFEARGMELGA